MNAHRHIRARTAGGWILGTGLAFGTLRYFDEYNINAFDTIIARLTK